MSAPHFALYDKAYALLRDVTPRREDCGQHCGRRCCHTGSFSNASTGMLLFPGEKEYLLAHGVNASRFTETDDGTLFVCDGHCDRRLRPLACRMFPYYPHIESDGRLRILHDLRALSVCPLLTSRSLRRAPVRFLRSMKSAARLLQSDPEIAAELQKNSDFLSSLAALCNSLYSKARR